MDFALMSWLCRGLKGLFNASQRIGLFVIPAFFIFDLMDLGMFVDAAKEVYGNDTSHNASELDSQTCTREASPCKHGLLVPMWEPQGDLSNGDKAARATVYLVAMVYMFLGVSIIADRFMASIEVITSKEKDVVIKKPDGTVNIVSVRIWNETVSNLTLMALGSSAPEILLSVIEICGNGFNAGDLGPSTIVGSAAFNLFVIIAICVYCIPNDEVRRIKHLRVFFITATWSIFAYLWLYFIISVNTKGIVEVWEAVLTFLFFPGTVVTAYIADRKILVYKFLSKKYGSNPTKTVVIQSEGLNETEMADGKINQISEEVVFKGLDSSDNDVREFEKHRRDFIEILRDLRSKNPNMDMKTLEEMAEYEAVNRGPKSRAFYRIQATRKLTGGGKVIKKAKIERRASVSEDKFDEEYSPVTQVYFDPGHYTVMENVGSFNVTVTREGGDMSKQCYVDYTTEDGTANAGSDYIKASGTLHFQPQERHKQFEITILDDDVFEEDEHFYVSLSSPYLKSSSGHIDRGEDHVVLATPFMATVMILDDDHPGIFHFEAPELTVTENIGEVLVKVCRSSGARGCVRVPYHAMDGTAKAGKDYDVVSGEIFFENDETEQFIKIHIIDDEEYEKTETFQLELGIPQIVRKQADRIARRGIKRWKRAVAIQVSDEAPKGANEKEKPGNATPIVHPPHADDDRVAEMGKPRLGESTVCTVMIKESQEFKSTVDKLLKKANVSLVVGTSSWREQFVDAITVSAGDDDDDDDAEENEEKLPSCMDYVMHFLTLFWKILFAFVPPTDYVGGWACFCVSILVIGFLTAIIGDLASSFGCTVGMKDAVTAITFVALGTSVPDTFASKVAAINDRYADSSIGNVTGSNAVNVFLGIGIAWTIAAVYHASNGDDFRVHPGELAMSVTVFCILALFTIVIIVLRRKPSVGGELGGPPKSKYITSATLGCFWCIYILISSLVAYCYIPSF